MTTYKWFKYSIDTYWNESPTSPNVYTAVLNSSAPNNLIGVLATGNSQPNHSIPLSTAYKNVAVAGTAYPGEDGRYYYRGTLAMSLNTPATAVIQTRVYFKPASTVYEGIIVDAWEYGGIDYIEVGYVSIRLVNQKSAIYEHKIKDDYIEEVTGEDDAYPIDGVHSDGYWYTKSSIDESATIIQPNGGETTVGVYQIQWTLTDATIKTKIELSTNGGSTWQTLTTTSAGATTYDYDFSTTEASSQCLIRLTPTDGSVFGVSDTSATVFTNPANNPPTQPTELSPAGGVAIDKTIIQRLSWQHNDQDAQSKFDLDWSDDDGTTWTTITRTTSSQYHDFAADYFPTGSISWKVRTYDQFDEVSPYSAQAVFEAAAPSDAPTITSSNNTAVARPLFEWTQSDQTAYQIEIYDSTMTLVWDSGQITSTNKSAVAGIDLINNSTYTLKIRTKNSANLWSSYVSQSLTVSYTPPEVPILSTLADNDRGTITLIIINPAGATEAIYNDVYRDGLRIAQGVMNAWIDYTPISGRTHQYQVTAWGANGTFRNSALVDGVTSILYTQLASTTDYSKCVQLKYHPTSQVSKVNNSVSNLYSGRALPVVEFDGSKSDAINLKYMMIDDSEVQAIEELQDSLNPLLFRDKRGHKYFVVIENIGVSYDKTDTKWVDIILRAIDYNEVV